MARKRIYISPSKQPHNAYWGKIKTNEQATMEAVYRAMLVEFAKYDCYIIPTTLSKRVFSGAGTRTQEAIDAKADIYLAMHSNATGNPPSSLVGANIFYKPDKGQRDKAAEEMRKELNAAQPYPVNRSRLIDGYAMSYGEVRHPENGGAHGYLVEVHWHDNPTMADWIAKNPVAIARATVRAVTIAYNIPLKSSGGSGGSGSGETIVYYVKSGDSLSRIAQNVLDDGSRWPEIARLNPAVKAPNYMIFAGQKLIVPKPDPEAEPSLPRVRLKKNTPIFNERLSTLAADGIFRLTKIENGTGTLYSGAGVISMADAEIIK